MYFSADFTLPHIRLTEVFSADFRCCSCSCSCNSCCSSSCYCSSGDRCVLYLCRRNGVCC